MQEASFHRSGASRRRSNKDGWVGRASALLARDEAEKPPKTKRLFRQAQRTVSHAGS
jgi:hypothetical protein